MQSKIIKLVAVIKSTRLCFCSSTFLVDFGDIFDLLVRPGGHDLNQHVVISAGALGARHNSTTHRRVNIGSG